MTSAESFDSNAIEVNGIRFETLVPDPVVILPKKSLVKKILHLLQFLSPSPSSQLPSVPIKLGLSITNNTSKAFRFSFYPTLPTMMPQIVGSDGQEIKLLKRDFFRLMIQSESDFPLAIPGETVTFFLNAEILWCQGNHFVMIVTSTDGFFCMFGYLNPGKYQIKFKYNNQDITAKSFGKTIKEVTLFTGLWTGEVETPYKEFYLVSS